MTLHLLQRIQGIEAILGEVCAHMRIFDVVGGAFYRHLPEDTQRLIREDAEQSRAAFQAHRDNIEREILSRQESKTIA